MRDAFLVRGFQGIQDLPRLGDSFGNGHRSLQWRPFNELHHEVVGAYIV